MFGCFGMSNLIAVILNYACSVQAYFWYASSRRLKYFLLATKCLFLLHMAWSQLVANVMSCLARGRNGVWKPVCKRRIIVATWRKCLQLAAKSRYLLLPCRNVCTWLKRPVILATGQKCYPRVKKKSFLSHMTDMLSLGCKSPITCFTWPMCWRHVVAYFQSACHAFVVLKASGATHWRKGSSGYELLLSWERMDISVANRGSRSTSSNIEDHAERAHCGHRRHDTFSFTVLAG